MHDTGHVHISQCTQELKSKVLKVIVIQRLGAPNNVGQIVLHEFKPNVELIERRFFRQVNTLELDNVRMRKQSKKPQLSSGE